MTPNVLLAPYPEFSDESGKPLENGQLYIGVADMEPQENPVIAYWDEALTIPAAQPVRTSGGYPMHNGTPGRLYTDGVCSLLVLNRRSEFVYYAPRVIDMNSVSGFIESNNMRVKDYAELRDYSGPATIVDVISPGIAGRFYFDNSAVENGGTQIVGIKKWSRLDQSRVTLKMFGAKGDDSTDDSLAVNSACAWAASAGRVLYVTAGTYIVSQTTTINLNNSSLKPVGSKFGLIGEGANNTVFKSLITSDFVMFEINGSPSADDMLRIEGLRFEHADVPTGIGTGITMRYGINIQCRDLMFFRLRYGMIFRDVNACLFETCRFYYCVTGFTAQIDTLSEPNALTFRNCYFASNHQNGVVINNGVVNKFESCTFEGNGVDNNGVVIPSAAAIAVSNTGIGGAADLTVDSCYFEGNAGNSDIYATHVAAGTYRITGNTFNRIYSNRYVTNDIVFDASTMTASGGKCSVFLNGNGFHRANTYVPSSARKRVNYVHGLNFDNFTINDSSNYYIDAIERPVINPTKDEMVGDSTQAKAVAYVLGVDGSMNASYGFASCVRLSTGLYFFTLSRDVGLAIPVAISGSAGLSPNLANVVGTSFQLQFTNNAGVATDPLFFVVSVFGTST